MPRIRQFECRRRLSAAARPPTCEGERCQQSEDQGRGRLGDRAGDRRDRRGRRMRMGEESSVTGRWRSSAACRHGEPRAASCRAPRGASGNAGSVSRSLVGRHSAQTEGGLVLLAARPSRRTFSTAHVAIHEEVGAWALRARCLSAARTMLTEHPSNEFATPRRWRWRRRRRRRCCRRRRCPGPGTRSCATRR